MAGTAYHMEALRKARLNERKTDAVRKLQDSLGQGGAEYVPISVDENPEPLVFSEPGQYLTNRCPNVGNKDVVFEEVVHDPNYRYRLLKQSGNNPIHVDPIYKIMYPGGQIPRK